MILVGLTGGIASGKSLVSECFKRHGAYIIDADELAHRAIERGTEAYKSIRGEFGSDILKLDGTIDRKKLGNLVFNNPEKRKRLNSIVHPHVFAEKETLRKEIEKRDPKAVIIFDAALLIETGAHQWVDKVILVTVDHQIQLKRLMERDGLLPEEAEKRIATQASSSEKKRHADYVIDGALPLKEIERRVAEIQMELASRA